MSPKILSELNFSDSGKQASLMTFLKYILKNLHNRHGIQADYFSIFKSIVAIIFPQFKNISATNCYVFATFVMSVSLTLDVNSIDILFERYLTLYPIGYQILWVSLYHVKKSVMI